MPLYEYVCTHCNHEFEELVFGDNRPSCPKCSAGDVERTLSVTAPGRVKEAAPAMGPCGSCGNANGPGSCGLN